MENIFLFTMTDLNVFLRNWTKQALKVKKTGFLIWENCRAAGYEGLVGLRTNSSKVIQV